VAVFDDPLDYRVARNRKDAVHNAISGRQGRQGTLAVLNRDGLSAAVRFYFADELWLLGLFAPALALLLVVYLATLIGVATLIKRRKLLSLFLLSLPLLYLMLIPGAPSNQRFRVPALPYINILAAQGMVIASCTFRKRISN